MGSPAGWYPRPDETSDSRVIFQIIRTDGESEGLVFSIQRNREARLSASAIRFRPVCNKANKPFARIAARPLLKRKFPLFPVVSPIPLWLNERGPVPALNPYERKMSAINAAAPINQAIKVR